MLKKAVTFYLGSIFLSVIYYFTIGGVIGWFATEGGSAVATCIVCLITFIGLMLISYLFIKKSFSNYALEQYDVWKFLLPYFILLAIFCVLYICDILKDSLFANMTFLQFLTDDTAKWIIPFLLPYAYIILLMWGIFNFSYTAFYLTAIVCSVLHILVIAVLLTRKRKATELLHEAQHEKAEI